MSIYTAESTAIRQALMHIKKIECDSAIIISDSLSVLNNISKPGNHIREDWYTAAIKFKIRSLHHLGKKVSLTWAPSHLGIPSNEHVDKLAKSSANLTSTCNFAIPL